MQSWENLETDESDFIGPADNVERPKRNIIES